MGKLTIISVVIIIFFIVGCTSSKYENDPAVLHCKNLSDKKTEGFSPPVGCLISLAVNRSDMEICNEISNNSIYSIGFACGRIAIDKNDSNQCNLLNLEERRAECIDDFAMNKLDFNACDKLDDGERNSCIFYVIGQNWLKITDWSVCEKLLANPESYRTWCYATKDRADAVKNTDFNTCDKLDTEEAINSCYGEVMDINWRNITDWSICDKFPANIYHTTFLYDRARCEALKIEAYAVNNFDIDACDNLTDGDRNICYGKVIYYDRKNITDWSICEKYSVNDTYSRQNCYGLIYTSIQ